MSTREDGAEILDRQACDDPRCLCATSQRKGRGPSHCPLCVEQPNLALRVRGDAIYCKAGCDQEQLHIALIPRPVTDSRIGAVTYRPYRRRSCVWCGTRLERGRRDRLVCGDACRQRRHRSLAAS